MGTPEDVAAEKYFTPPEVEVNKLVIHHWEKRTHHGSPVNCDCWDCPHKIQDGETYYLELYPEEQCVTLSLECSAFFMAQAIDFMLPVIRVGGLIPEKREINGLKFRTPVVCQNGHRAFWYWQIDDKDIGHVTHFGVPDSEKCSCPKQGLGEGYSRAGADELVVDRVDCPGKPCEGCASEGVC